jgi:hypothetical protein
MKKLIIISIIILSIAACKKTKFAPEGPTDVRIYNMTDLPFTEVTVTIDDSTKILGNVIKGAYTPYIEFHKAFPIAEISAKINGVLYTTGKADTKTMTYIGQAKITYDVYISDFNNKKLTIDKCTLDAPLD